MKRDIFCTWIVIAVAVGAVVFALVSLGGCGGSSSSGSGGSSSPEDDVTMSDIWDDDEAMNEVFDRLTSEDAFKLLGVKMEGIERKDDGSVRMQYFDAVRYVLSDEEYPEIPYSTDELKTRYENGAIILIGEADLELVNRVRTDLGLPEENSAKFGQSGSLEVYGLARIKTNGLRNLFVYVVPRMGDIAAADDAQTNAQDTENDVSSGDLPDSQDVVPEKEEVTQEAYTMRDFQIERWVNFIKWMGDLSVMSLRNSAFASDYTVRAAANDDLTSIADAQTETFNFSYNNINTSYSIFTGRYTYSFTRSRNNFVSVTIYSAHSFTSGKDYYIVQGTTTTVPKNFQDTYIYWNDYKRNVLYGYTRTASTEYNIDGGNMATSDVSLLKHSPANINENKSYSEGMEWEVNGKVGVNKDGVAAEVGGGVKFSKSVSWSVSEYKLVNDSMKDHPASAKWYVDVQSPGNGDTHYVGAPFIYYQGVNATAASRNQIQYSTYFMWEVGKNYWKNHSNMRMYVNFKVEDGFCMGWCNQGFKEYDRYDETDSRSGTQSVTLEQPTHTAVSSGSFAFTAGGAGAQSFTLLAEDSWRMTGIPSWVTFTETSGGATGGTDKLLLFDVAANTTGSPRSATITIESGRDKVNVQIAQTGN